MLQTGQPGLERGLERGLFIPWKAEPLCLQATTLSRKPGAGKGQLPCFLSRERTLQLTAISEPTRMRLLVFFCFQLLSGFLSRERVRGLKHKELFLDSGLWLCSLILFTHPLSRFAQPDHRNTNLQGQVNRGNQIVSSQQMAIEQPWEPRAL